MRGSGFEEVVIEAGLCATGLLEKVLIGKHYNRCFAVHTVMLEALERLLFTSFVQNTGSGEQVQQLFHQTKQLENNLAANVADAIVVSDEFNEVFSQYEAFKEKVCTGLFGKLSQFWIQYMDRVGLLLQFSLATRKNNIDLHISSLQDLCPLLFSMNHQNYAKYLSCVFHYAIESSCWSKIVTSRRWIQCVQVRKSSSKNSG